MHVLAGSWGLKYSRALDGANCPMTEALTPALFSRAVLEREERAMARVVEALTPVLHARVASILLRCRRAMGGRVVRQEVEDLTQDVFALLFSDGGKRLLAWRPERGTPGAWFGLLAERFVLDTLRSRRRSPFTDSPTDDVELETEPEHPTQERRVVSHNLLALLAERLEAQLNERDRQLFRLLYVEELSDDEVQARLGLSQDALYQARRRLKQRVAAVVSTMPKTGENQRARVPGATP
ncbi:MAG: hypothetical protein AMXMBFR64_38920 [Myxococcales bacterium]